MSDLKFGTSGLRGLVSELTDDVIQNYSQAFLKALPRGHGVDENNTILIGHDLRASSPHMANIVMQTCLDQDYKVINGGALPTPALALFSLTYHIPAIMVTGSHIPEDRNGLKFYRPDGEIDKADEKNIQKNLLNQVPELTITTLPDHSPKPLEQYIKRCLTILSANALNGKKIGVYQHSSVARDLMVQLIESLGGTSIVIERADHFIPVDTEALREEDRIIAQKACRTYKLDALISTDGDADRPLLADENGDYIRGDLLGLLSARYLKADCIVTPVTSTSIAEPLFDKVYRCRVGSPYVIETMQQAQQDGFQSIVGFEANGGVLLGSTFNVAGKHLDALPTRDAMLPILAVLGLALQKQMSLSQLRTILPQRFNASDRKQNMDMEKVAHLIEKLKNDAVADFFAPQGTIVRKDAIDGLRVQLNTGDVIHFRASGNAPELRCYAESDHQNRADTLVQWGLSHFNEALEG